MKFSVDPMIFEKFPGVVIGVVAITSINNTGHNEELLKLLRAEEARQKELLKDVELGSLHEVSAWRQIYKDFGSGGKDYRSSVESLLRRARGGQKPLPQINNLVDLYNYISLKYRLPSGAEDLDKVVGDISLTFAKGDEKGVALGKSEEESCYSGEVIYKDGEGFICRRWNWREADRTKIDEHTKNAVLVIEKVVQVGDDVLGVALSEVKSLIGSYLSATCQVFQLSSIKQEVEC